MFSIINPLNYPWWDEILLSTEGYSFFHSSSWAEVLIDSYGFTPFYFSSIHDKRISLLIPLMEVDSFISGRRGISLPFSDFCEPIIDEGISFIDLFFEIVKFAKRRGWRYIEFRGGKDLFNSFNLLEINTPSFIIHKIDLKKGIDNLYKELRDSNKRNIKKASNLGVKVNFSRTWESMENFYSLNSITRKRHGLPSQPKPFFKNFYDKVIAKNRGIIALAFYNGHPVSAYIFCLFGNKAIYKYGASDLNFQNLRPNNLLMWESIKWLCENGFEELSLGRTEWENEGLRQFKKGWGAEEDFISYFNYDLKKEDFVLQNHQILDWQKWILKRLPIPVLNLIGSIFYRHAA